MKYLLILLSVLICIAGTIPALSQSGGEISAAGKQTLKSPDVDTLIEFYEWALEARFTAQQRQDLAANTAREFNDDPSGTRKTIDQIIANMTKIRSISPDSQQKVREAFLGDFLPAARKDTAANSQMLVRIYDEAHAKSASQDGSNATAASKPTAAAAGNVAQFASKWVWASSGSTTTTTSGVYLGGNASRHTYEFSANGDVEYIGIMNVMSGACRMQIFKTSRGKASLVGDKLTVSWQPATFSRDDSCTPSQNYKKTLPAETEVFQVGFKMDYGQRQLCMTQKSETCYSPTDK